MANYLDLNGTTDVVNRLKGKINEKASNSDVQLIVNELALKADKTEVEAVKERVDEIETYKFPNVTIFGTPQISNGQMSGFSATNYAQFPFLVDFKGQRFEINMCFTTGENVTTQQNIIDSQFGLAMAIRNGKFVIAMSSDGQTWDMGEHIGVANVNPMATYYLRLTWDGSAYDLLYSVDKATYSTDIHFVDSKTLFPRRIVIGKGFDNTHIFGGSINLNYCSLSIMGHEVWAGMDDVGLATRLATDLSNIDNAGVEKVVEIANANEKDPVYTADKAKIVQRLSVYNMHDYGSEEIQFDVEKMNGYTDSSKIPFATINGQSILQKTDIKIEGGGEPDEYIKDASKSSDGNTLTLTKKDGTEVVFAPSGGGGGNYLPLTGGTLTGHLQLGSGTETSFKKVEAIRNINGVPNGAAFYVNSDGTAAFFHKTYSSTALAGAVNDAILRFDHNGLTFAKGATDRTTATEYKKVMTEEDTYSKAEIDALIGNINNALAALING